MNEQQIRFMKITLEYNKETGEIKDAEGQFIISYMGVKSFEPEIKGKTTKDLVQLAEAGFSASDIMEMKKRDIF